MLLVTFVEMISNPMVICAIILAAVGIAMSLLATKITKTVRKSATVAEDDKLLLCLKIAGIALILFAFLLLFLWGMVGFF